MQYKNGIFYLLPPSKHVNNNEFQFEENLVCLLTKEQWRLGKNILIACENKLQADRMDKSLWIYDKDSFLPHNLFGKKTYNVPIVLYWSQCCYDNIKRDLLINLMKKHMNFFFNFNEIIDFVPSNVILKKWARVRYRFYKKIGFNISITDVSDFTSN